MKRWLLLAFTSGCITGGVANTGPVAELPATEVFVRGTDAQAARLSNADEAQIVSNVVRGFFRPPRNQVRWISPLMLSNYNSATSGAGSDTNRANALVQAIGLPNVCSIADKSPCENKPGGSLRFSQAYGLAPDTAVIFARYTPLGTPGQSEIEFRMVRRPQGWQMLSRRSVIVPVEERGSAIVAATNRLLETDRAYGTAARGTDLVTALSAMFDDSVIVQIPGGFADGKQAAVASLRSNKDNERSHATWAPIRVGMSADSKHGFSYGYMTLVRPDSTRVPLKYLAYWVNRDGEWKVLAYKRRGRPAGEVSMEMLPPALPAPSTVAYRLSSESLAAAEKAFSDTSRVIGVGPAFELNGRADAMNMGGPTDTAFVIGNKAIARSVGAGFPPGPGTISWAADYKRIVAPSGDLGVTFGYIRPDKPQPGQPQAFPFFTIWKRDPGNPWRYIAE